MESARPRSTTQGFELTVIVVAYNAEGHISRTIEKLELSLGRHRAEIIIIDNNSLDRTGELADRALTTGSVVSLSQNVGYGRGANEGLRRARGRFSIIMNDDVTIDSESIDMLLSVLEKPNVRLVAPRMANPTGGTLPSGRRYLPGLRDEVARIGDFVTRRRRRLVEPLVGPPVRVDFVLAACLMVESQFLRSIGGFSDRFFMYGEDIDLCRRVKEIGGDILLVPSATACHDQAVAGERRFRGHEFTERILSARDTYYRIWLPTWERILVNLIRALGPRDQPFRFKHHISRAFSTNDSLAHERMPRSLEPLFDESNQGS